MLLIQKALKEVGIGGDIFARHVRPDPWKGARLFSEKLIWNCDLLLIHHSQGSPWLNRVLGIEVPKALIYHNITPAEYFRHDSYIANLSRLGRAQLLLLQKEVKRAFGDSKYNLKELEELGFKNPERFPLLDLEHFSISKRKETQAKRFLFVGKITPHKNQALLVKVFFYLRKILPTSPQLCLVGGSDPLYGRYVRLLIQLLGLQEHVALSGKATNEDLDEHYKYSDAYISMSLHEGFGVPLVEAMRFGLPVFALPHAAIPETLGKAGFRIKGHHPLRIAQQIAADIQNEELRRQVLQAQIQRFKELQKTQTTPRIQELIQETLHAIHT